MVYIILAEGFEMIEALTPCDVLRRAGLDVRLVSLSGKPSVLSTHRVEIGTDMPLSEVDIDQAEMILLPGGMPGAENLYACELLRALVLEQARRNKPLAAICAAPLVLGRLGLLKGKHVTCYPGFEKDLLGAVCLSQGVVSDGNVVTAKGMGVSLSFSLAACELLVGKDKADAVAASIMAEKGSF